ncbi:unnamed protein product [Orchesella dallaii]|uniref:YjeF N-terminal domain-containing protein n=1 Tax=Orchesella dallaii TaxID=48710 RepID=A0ABP1PZK2_9HEXA
MNDDKQHSLCITEKTISKCKCFPSLRQSLKKKITKLQYFRQNFKLTMSVANSTGPKDPLWKRRGVNQMTPLVLDPAIRGDITLEERYPELYEPIMVVNDSEWVQRSCWFEVHPTDQVNEGVVIDPPCYPSWYSTNTTGKVVAAHLPFTVEYLIGKAMSYGYQLDTLMQRMGSTVADYCSTLILPRRRDIQSVLILAGEHWQGASAIYSGRCLRRMGLQVSLYLDSNAGGTREELQFLNEGGKIYRNLNDMKGLKFRVVVVALENNYSRISKLTHFGEWLQNSVAVFFGSSRAKMFLYSCSSNFLRGEL